jgi:predicted flap endonuclease-1-like 5' DNA nuclease
MKEGFDFKGVSISKIEGIGPKYAAKLAKAGIKTTRSLLEKAATKKGRTEVAEASGIGEVLILEWVNLADLFRINGIGEEFSDLLEETGVDTVVELAKRKPENLHKALCDFNEAKKLSRRTPSLKQVEGWIKQAKGLPRIVKY